MKDIYSPLEIDEQWDQRAPMSEGDAMASTIPGETSSTTATMEPVASDGASHEAADTMPMPTAAEPAVTTEPHIELHSDTNQMMPAAEPENTDDDAAAKLSGSDTIEGDHVAEEATTDPSDSAMDNMNPQPGQSVMPTETLKPAEPRKQPEEKASHDDVEPEDTTPVADTNEHFVLGSTDSGESTEEPEPETPEETPTPEVAVETNDDDIDSKIEAAMAKIDEAIAMLRSDKEAAAAAVAKHEQDESEAREAKEHAQTEQDKIDAELSKLEGLKPAA